MEVFIIIIIALILVACLLAGEMVKQARLLAMFEDELADAHKEIQRLRSQGGGGCKS